MTAIYTVGFSVLGESTKVSFEHKESAAVLARDLEEAGHEPTMWDHRRNTYDYWADPPVPQEDE